MEIEKMIQNVERIDQINLNAKNEMAVNIMDYQELSYLMNVLEQNLGNKHTLQFPWREKVIQEYMYDTLDKTFVEKFDMLLNIRI